MLDSDESELFDEATRTDTRLGAAAREMNCMAAAVAAACTTPLLPKSGQLERIHARLAEGRRPRRRIPPVFAYAGWGVAAVLALLLALRGGDDATSSDDAATADAPAVNAPPATIERPAPVETKIPDAPAEERTAESAPVEKAPDVATGLAQARTTTRAETKRLVQEIETLRDNLERFQQRDRAVFETVPGRAWPIVMTMTPPNIPFDDTQGPALADDPSRITNMLGDALAGQHRTTMGAASALDPNAREQGLTGAMIPQDPAAAESVAPQYPSAIPIYDAARDTGTLVVTKLPPAPRDEAYNLWVTTENGNAPIFVGTLPVSDRELADSFDFSLGSNMVLPTGFLLTRDPITTPTRPNSSNTVLKGPPVAASAE